MSERERLRAEREALWAKEARLEASLKAKEARLERFFTHTERALEAEVEIWRGRLARQREEVLRHSLLVAEQNLKLEQSETRTRLTLSLDEDWWKGDFLQWVEQNQSKWRERVTQKGEVDLRAAVDLAALTRLFGKAPPRPPITAPAAPKIHKVDTLPAPKAEDPLPTFGESLVAQVEGFAVILGTLGAIFFLNKFDVEDNAHLLSLIGGITVILAWLRFQVGRKREAQRRASIRAAKAQALSVIKQRLQEQLNHQRDRLDKWLTQLHRRWLNGLEIWREAEIAPLYEKTQHGLSMELRQTQAEIEVLDRRIP